MKTTLQNIVTTIIFIFSFFIASAQPGTLDSSFGVNGKVTKNFGYNYSAARASAIQQDGKIVVVGSTIPYNTNNKFLISRFLANGNIDSGFGVNGNIVTTFDTAYIAGPTATSVILQADSKILVGGFDYQVSAFLIARYLPNGKLDSTFSNDGKVNFILPFGETELLSLALQKDGKILAGGNCDGYCLLRFLPNGELDSSFGINGKVLSQDFHFITDIQVQSDGKIITAGTTDFPNNKIELVRRLSNGNQDSTFGLNGIVQTSFFNDLQEALSIGILTDGNILMTGFGFDPSVSLYRPIIAKYRSNGNLDSSFGANGKVVTEITSTDVPYVGKLLVQNDGKIIITGNVSQNNFTVSRFKSNGISDSSFGVNGNAIASFGIASNAMTAMLQSDGKIIAVGTPSFSLARFKGVETAIVSLAKNVSVTEGNSGTTPVQFKVALDKPSTTDVFVNYTTKNITATAGSDYITSSGTVRIKAGKTKANIILSVIGDNVREANERFAVVLSNPVNAALGTDSVVCVIKNDDAALTAIASNNENLQSKSINIYPNPAKDRITIEGLTSETKIVISDVNGKPLIEAKTTSSLFQQNIKQLAAGTYYIKIETENKIFTQKIIKL